MQHERIHHELEKGFGSLVLLVAAVSAATFLVIGNLVHKRFGI